MRKKVIKELKRFARVLSVGADKPQDYNKIYKQLKKTHHKMKNEKNK